VKVSFKRVPPTTAHTQWSYFAGGSKLSMQLYAIIIRSADNRVTVEKGMAEHLKKS